MKLKKIISLVIITFLLVLCGIGTKIYYFDTRDNIILDNSGLGIDEKKVDTTEEKKQLQDKSDSGIIESDDKQSNDTKPVAEVGADNTKESTISNNTDINSPKKQETIISEKKQDNTVIHEITDEDNKDNINSFENDEEYKQLKATLVYETRSDCQKDADVVGPKYAIQGNLRNTSCQSFAYKGNVIGYRMQIFFKDGTWIYDK